MKTKILFLATLMLVLTVCNAHSASSYYGKWSMVTIENDVPIILHPCDAQNREIIYEEGLLVDISGQEEISCRVISSFSKDGRTFVELEPGCNYADTLSFEVAGDDLLKWDLYHGLSFLYTNHPENYEIVQEECEQEFLTSYIRPGEPLQQREIYTDEVEYVEYNDQGDYAFFVVKKDGERIVMLDAYSDKDGYPAWIRGDLVEVQWNMDSWDTDEDQDEEFSQIRERALSINKLEDGKLARFRVSHPEPIPFHYETGLDFSDDFLIRIRDAVEYYLANSTQELVLAALDDPSASIGYSIEEKERHETLYYVIGIYSDFENRTNVFQWLYLSDAERAQMYERDPQRGTLVEFGDW